MHKFMGETATWEVVVSKDLLPPMIRALLLPQAYDHPVTTPIKVCQTHISYVLLTGLYAYKIKKPVDLGFVNFTTLERRQFFCERELILNRRFSPEIYLDVLPICKTPRSFNLQGRGQVVDYAVKMMQFSGEGLLQHRLKSGNVSPQEMRNFGRSVALLHKSLPVSPHANHFGGPVPLSRVASENFQQTEKFVGGLLSPTRWMEIRAFTRKSIIKHKALVRQRVTKGAIRECHGDLHMGNVCTIGGQLRLFDCIEFKDAFSHIDTLYDVAFLMVSLDVQGYPQHAIAFFNAWLEETGEYEAVLLLPLYKCIRAYILAKINSMMTLDPHVDHSTRIEKGLCAKAYYQLAWSYTAQAKGQLYVVGGLSGSGKSTVSAYLAQKLNALHLRSDAVRKHLAHIPLRSRGSQELYSSEMGNRTYSFLKGMGLHLGKNGFSVVLDGKFDRRHQRVPFLFEAAASGLQPTVIWCHAPDGVLKERIANRHDDISDAQPEMIEGQRAKMEPPHHDEGAPVLSLDTTRDWRKTLDQLFSVRRIA